MQPKVQPKAQGGVEADVGLGPVLVSPEDLESLEETLAIMSDPALMAQIGESRQAIADGEPGATVGELRAEHERRRNAAASAYLRGD
jgi:hypothetical protein